MFTTDSFGNIYFPAGLSLASIPATTGTQARVLVPGPGGRISSATIAQLITQSGGNLVTSVFGRTGAVVAKQGDYTTDQITEGRNGLYFSNDRVRKAIALTTFNTSGPATYDSITGILNIPQYGSGTSGNFVPLTRKITINNQTADLSIDRIFSVKEMVYPAAGIPLSNGISWQPSIVNNSDNWNTAYGWGNHALAGYALDSQVVHNTGAETVAGLKTFTSAVKAPNFILSGGTGNTGMYFGHTDRLVLANYTVGGGIDFESNGGVINGTLFSSGNWGFSPSAVDDTINRVQVGGYVIATGYRIPSGTASQFLKANGSIDSTSYVPTTRTLTINGTAYDLSSNREWTISAYTMPIASATVLGGVKVGTNLTIDVDGVLSANDTSVAWSELTGVPTTFTPSAHTHTIANVTGLQTALDGKEPTIAAGTTAQYWRGDKSWQTLPTYANFTRTVSGLVPNPGAATTNRYLREDGTWVIPPDNDTVYVHPTTAGNKHIPAGGTAGEILRWSADGTAVWGADNDTTYAVFTRTVNGLTPASGGTTGTTKYLREDGTWQVPPDTDTNTWNANSLNVAGYVAAPGAVSNKVWKTDASGNPAWRDDADTTYTLAGLGGLPLAGGIMTGAITLKEGAANGLKFPNDVFGGSGDTAGMRLIARSGEAMSLEVYLTNDADDWFNISVPSDNGAKVNGNTIWHAANLTNLNQLTNGPGYITSYTDTNTWDANSKTVAGYVAAPGAVANKVWKTDASGNPAWRDDADTIVTSLAWTSITGRPTALSSFTNDLGNYGGWYSASGGTISGDVTISGASNTPLTINQVQPYVDLNATGATNKAGIRIYPSLGYDADIGNFRGGALNLLADSYVVAKVTKNAGVIFYTSTTGPITSIGSNTSASMVFINGDSSNKTWDISMYANDWILNESNVTTRFKVLAGGGVYADAFYEFSDKRHKTLVQENPNITGIGSITTKLYIKEGKTELGYFAQDFEGILDSAILKDKDGVLSLSYRQVHTAKIAALEKRIAELEAKLK